jgi:hypothetical protein
MIDWQKQLEAILRKQEKAEAELENIELSTEDLRTISTSIFISTQRKFDL